MSINLVFGNEIEAELPGYANKYTFSNQDFKDETLK